MSKRNRASTTLLTHSPQVYVTGDKPNGAYRVREGVVLFCAETEDGRSLGCGLALAGQTFGEERVINTSPVRRHTAFCLYQRSVGFAVVETVSPTCAMLEILSRDAFDRLIFVERLLAAKHASDRIQMVINAYGALHLTHDVIGKLVRTRREIVSTVLKRIRLENRQFVGA